MTTRRWQIAIILGLLVLLLLFTTRLATAPGEPPLTGDGGGQASAQQQTPDRELDRTGYVKGIYVSHAALSHADLVQHVQDLLQDTELNAVVMDFKSDRGQLSFPTAVTLAEEIGAAGSPVVQDPAAFLGWFKSRDVCLIARIPAFKDDLLARGHPEWAVWNEETGEVWRDAEGMGWIDPNRRESWDYNVALAVEAAQMGFDEVQFDYVRFPTDGHVGNARFASLDTLENRTAAITGLLRQTKAALQPLNVRLAADVFGYAPWIDSDLGIGHQIEAIAPHLDVLSPMVYPSTFDTGLPGEAEQYKNAIAYPYDVVNKSTVRTLQRSRAVNPRLDVRPWLQDFPDYNFDGRTYTPDEIRDQMRGAREAGARGWMLWDPAVRYTRQALVSAAPATPPNLMGRVAIIAYRDISSDAGASSRSPVRLRADLELLLAGGYYPVNLRDLVLSRLNMVPAGKRPVVLTFDGSSAGQFKFGPDGSIDPDTAVGVLTAFHAEHPADWPLAATFFIRGDGEVFGTPELAAAKLKLLTDWGIEIGILPGDGQPPLAGSSAQEIEQAIMQSLGQTQSLLPGYTVVSLAVPGAKRLSQTLPLPQGTLRAVVSAEDGLSASPLVPQFTPYDIPRLPLAALDNWLMSAATSPVYYSSPGELLSGVP